MRACIPAVIVGCLANVEVLIFDHASNSLASLPQLEKGVNSGNITAFPEVVHYAVNAEPGTYFCRVCWPASEPADFEIIYTDGILSLSASRADVVALGETDPTVRYHLHLSRQFGGIIPEDTLPTVARLTALALGTLGLCYILLS